ncbi:MAG: hypothetical protein V3T35_07985 [Spirochaetia bacterium]
MKYRRLGTYPKWIVATKFGHRFHGFQHRSRLWRPEEVRRQIEEPHPQDIPTSTN